MKKKKILWLINFILLFSVCIVQAQKYGKVAISEVYFDSYFVEDQSYANHHAGEFIELYNSSTESIDISGWKIEDNVTSFTIPENTIIASGGFKVITFTATKSLFVQLFPEAATHEPDIILQSSFMLNNNIEKIHLLNTNNELISDASYYPIGWMHEQGSELSDDLINLLDLYDFDPIYGYKFLDNGENLFQSGAIPSFAKTGIRLFNADAFYKNGNNSFFQNGEARPFELHISVPLLNQQGVFSKTPVSLLDNENYVHTIVYQVPKKENELPSESSTDIVENVTYFDGLGRSKQSIAIHQGNTIDTDIIIHIGYDELGRLKDSYLPYTSLSNEGAFREGADQETKTHYWNNYQSDFTSLILVNAFSSKEFDNSPLNRVKKQSAPGYDWRLGGGHEIEFDYDSNVSNEVRFYKVDLDTSFKPTLNGGTSYYLGGQLFKTITKDENHIGSSKLHSTEEFKNKLGQVVLKRTYANIGSIVSPHDTYYVYDDYGNLTYVLPPKSEANSSKPNATTLSELCYQYQYDYRNRLVEKKVPGKDKEYIIYDKLDRPVLTQDGNLRSQGKWLFTAYDIFGRVAYSGIIYRPLWDGNTMQGHINSASYQVNAEKRATSLDINGTDVYYDNVFVNSDQISLTDIEVLTINYYDNYTFNFSGTPPTVNSYGVNSINKPKGLVTGSKVRVLGTDNWITTLNYYDEKSQIIHVYSENTYLLTTDILKNEYDFIGNIKNSKNIHVKADDDIPATVQIYDSYTYDHVGRLKKQNQTIGGVTETIVENEYDDLGVLETKKVGGKTSQNRLQNVDFKYNVRGWLIGINDVENLNDDLFSFAIGYNKNITGSNWDNSSLRLFNGNISETAWKTANDNKWREYQYDFDALNRLKEAKYYASNENNRYNLNSVYYDKNGNITSLNRSGHTDSNATIFGNIDALSYTYKSNSNQLNKVSDYSGDSGFKDGISSGDDYAYDKNGNMVSDANKSITNIEYNHLNLPKLVVVNKTLPYGSTGTESINYTYAADGTKLRKRIRNLDSTGQDVNYDYTEYAGGFIYGYKCFYSGCDVKKLQFFKQPEGYVKNTNEVFSYVYQFKDHLGNVRLSYSDSDNNGDIDITNNINTNEIVEESNYYPFGLKHKGYNFVTNPNGNSTAQKFKYNGVEYEEGLGLNLYEMDVRMYDPALGRFNGIDPVTHYYQGTSIAFDNNPIFWTDPSGADSASSIMDAFKQSGSGTTTWYNDENGGFTDIYRVHENDDGTYSGRKGRTALDGRNDIQYQVYNKKGIVTGIYNGKGAILDMLKDGIIIRDIDYNNGSLFTNLRKASVEFWTSDEYRTRKAREAIVAYYTSIIPFEGVMIGVLGKVASPSIKLLTQFSKSNIDDAVRLILKDGNKLKHLFPAKHNLGSLVQKLGSQENTVKAVLNAANGRLPASGVFNVPVMVGGQKVFIRGNVINGVIRLGTMFIK